MGVSRRLSLGRWYSDPGLLAGEQVDFVDITRPIRPADSGEPQRSSVLCEPLVIKPGTWVLSLRSRRRAGRS
jgi:hypothetical protein